MARVLVTGSTGTIGRALVPVLVDAGFEVRAGARRPTPSPAGAGVSSVRFDLDDERTLPAALHGVRTAVYLVHGLKRGRGYAAWEHRAALVFGNACHEAGVARIVYLGGPRPKGPTSLHLKSRLATGRALRESGVTTIELQASLVVDAHSESFRMVGDVVTRVPALALGSFAETRLAPVALDDVVRALVIACGLEDAPPILGVPGPDILTVRDLMEAVGRMLGRRMRVFESDLLSAHAAARVVGRLTNVDDHLAAEIMMGLGFDLLPYGPSVWQHDPNRVLVPFEAAASAALRQRPRPTTALRILESAVRRFDRPPSPHG